MVALDPTGWLSLTAELIRGSGWKQPCVAATTANITLSGTQTIDGRAVVAGERVLVKDQSGTTFNGIWVCQSGAWIRAFDMDQDTTTAVPSSEVVGAIVYVIAGTTNGGTLWRCTNTTQPTIGSVAIAFAQVVAAGGVTGFATPAIVFGTAAAAGSATTVIRSDSTVVAFDVTVPVTLALGDSAATGSATVAARRDHKHGMPALSTATPLVESGAGAVGTGTLSSRDDHVHPAAASTAHFLVIASSHSTPLVFDDIVQSSAGDDFVYST